jgi:L-iditol 2-dehydrogenase
MQALVWTAPRELVLREEPMPQPGPNEVIVEIKRVGICGSELSGYLGQSSIRKPPLIMGHEAAGRITGDFSLRLGDGSPAQAGTRVTFNPLITCGTCDRCLAGRESVCRNRTLLSAHRPGAFGQYVAVPAAQCFPLPDHVSETTGSLTEPLACGVRAVHQSRVTPDEPLLILGAGPIGLCCLTAAKAIGVRRILISDVQPNRLELARRWGAEPIDARSEDVVAKALLFAPGGIAATIDAVGADGTRSQAVRSAMPGGRIVFLGLHEEDFPLTANYLVRHEVEVIGSFAYTPREFTQALALLVEGAMVPSADWLEERPLEAGPASFEELLAGKAEAAKIVLQMP